MQQHYEVKDGYEYTTHIHSLRVSVSKAGGGTLGKQYAGYWHWEVMDTETGQNDRSDYTYQSMFFSGSMHTHSQTAFAVAMHYDSYVEELNDE